MRHGNPISLLLFILVMEDLSRMMDKVVILCYLKVLSAAIRGVGVLSATHLLFVDDSSVFCDAIATKLD